MALKTVESNVMDFLKAKIKKKKPRQIVFIQKCLAKGLGEATGVY